MEWYDLPYKDPEVQRAYFKSKYVPFATLSEKQKQAYRKKRRAYYQKNKLLIREKQREQKYGLEYGTINIIRKRQRGLCAICKEKLTLLYHVDHDHGCCPGRGSCGKCVRGLLCNNCNLVLGNAHDDPRILKNAVAYLRRKAT